MDKGKLDKLKDIKVENFVWVIYIIIIILSYYANSVEKKFLLYDDEKSKMIKNADYGEILKRFEYTVREYIKFYDYYRNQNISSETPDAFYIMLQTKLMILRKYDYNREEIYLEK